MTAINRNWRRQGSRILGVLSVAVVAAQFAGTAPAQSEGTQETTDVTDRVRDINEILGVLGTERPVPKPDAGVDCDALFQIMQDSKSAPSSAQRQAVQDCTAAAPRIDFAVPFDFGSADISKAALPQLNELGRALESPTLKAATFIVAGHTDRKGGRVYNISLSQRRAASVRTFLIENFAIQGRRLTPIGYGFEMPKLPAEPFAAANRRVELIRTK